MGTRYNERCDKIAVAEKNRFSRRNRSLVPQVLSAPQTDTQIYLSTAYSGKRKTAAWFAVEVGSNDAIESSATLSGSTELECVLVGALACLRTLPADQSVTVFTAQEYLSKGMSQWLPAWIARGWKTKAGEPVKYQAHWQALWRICQQRRVEFVFVKSRGDEPNFQRGKARCAELLSDAN